jgi:sigma-B regulation protein RsbU (phosphoserine phosphatase)
MRTLLSLPRRLSVGTYLTVTTTVVLVAVLSVVFAELNHKERLRVLAARQAAADMVTSVIAGAISAPLTFDDRDALARDLEDARATRGIVGLAAFALDRSEPIASSGSASGCVAGSDAIVVGAENMVFRHPVVDVEDRPIGQLCAVFSLAEDARELRETERGLVLRGALAAGMIALLLVVIARWRIVQPLERLATAARGIERGERRKIDDVGGNEELIRLARAFNAMGDAVADRERRLRDELDVAATLQVSILPRKPSAPGLEIAARMETATEVGGDYYDVVPVPDGCYLGIGDVSGHGLGTGIVALMLQSAVSALVREDPHVSPRDLACTVNRVLYENVRTRMRRRDHATLTLLRYTTDGRLRLAGAHEDIFVRRAATGTVDVIETPGTWVGAIASIERVTEEVEIALAPGDVVVLYTDGITEAMRGREQFGPERVRALLAAAGPSVTVDAIGDSLLAAAKEWANGRVADDMSVVVLRHVGTTGAERIAA